MGGEEALQHNWYCTCGTEQGSGAATTRGGTPSASESALIRSLGEGQPRKRHPRRCSRGGVGGGGGWAMGAQRRENKHQTRVRPRQMYTCVLRARTSDCARPNTRPARCLGTLFAIMTWTCMQGGGGGKGAERTSKLTHGMREGASALHPKVASFTSDPQCLRWYAIKWANCLDKGCDETGPGQGDGLLKNDSPWTP